MTKLWIINQAALTPRDSGGTRHYSLARALMAQGFDVTIITEAGGHMAGPEQVDGVQFFRLPGATSKRSHWHRLCSMFTFARQLLRPLPLAQPDLILGSSPPLFAAASACLLARRLEVPFVLELRDLWPESIVQITRLGRIHPFVLLLRVIERWLYRRADHIVTLLEGSVPYLTAREADAQRISVVPNGIDPSLIPLPPPVTPHKGFHLYYFGALGIPNALEEVIDAARLLHDEPIDFHFVGDGVRKAALMEMARDLPRVHFEPPVAKTQMGAVMAKADACLITIPDLPLYRWGVSPNKLYDYLYAGRPLLYAAGQAPGLIAQHGCGIYARPDAAAIADAARKLAQLSAEERAAMGERGRAYVLAYHDMRTLGAALGATLSSVRRRNG